VRHEFPDTIKKTQDCRAARILYQTRTGTTFLSQMSSNWSPPFPDVHRLLLKEEGMLDSGKQDSIPTLLRYFAAIKFQMFYCECKNDS